VTSLNVVLHAHSEWSYDASWPLPAIARLFGALGVGAVMMTEHDDGFSGARFADYRAACAAASTPRCALIPGIEYSSPDNDIHILTWGLDRFLGEHRPVAETLAGVAAAGGVAVFAHPARRDAWARYEDAWTPLLSGVEIWNRKTDGLAPGARALELMRRTGLPGLAGVDFHRINQVYPLDHRLAAAGADAGAAVVAAIRAGALAPRAFRRGLDLAGGFAGHARAERLRRRAARILRGR
jgi:predicted metal-dependent phosphoesterase TrpH